MALLLRPANVQKNIAASFTLDLDELAGLPKVPAGYYKDTNNWKEVYVKVKHSTSGQNRNIVFQMPSVIGTLLVSDSARAGVWGLESIMIRDFDRGEIVLSPSDIPNVEDYNFFVVSAATHGDLIITNGQTYVLPPNADRQYGDVIIDAGGTLLMDDGGGIAVIEALGNCVINGLIKGSQGKHTGGSWTKISPLGETLTMAITQNSGGNGGNGEGTQTTIFTGNVTAHSSLMVYFDAIPVGLTPYESIIIINGNNYIVTDFAAAEGEAGNVQVHANHGYLSSTIVAATVVNPVSGGIGGTAAFGNGAGGGRASKFIAMNGGDAIDVYAGVGAGRSAPAELYGQDGEDSTAPVYAGSGGFRGAHGQGLYLKARQIQGSGVVDFSGQKGGDGGDGGEYLSDGELYANGPGGGAAGGNGGKVWFRVSKGTPVVTVNIIGGEKGSRGVASSGATQAQHGATGVNGSFNLATF